MMKRIMQRNSKAKELDVSSHKRCKTASAILGVLYSTDISYFMAHTYTQGDDEIISFLFDKMINNFPNEYKALISFDHNCVSINNNNKSNTDKNDNNNNNNSNNILAPRHNERLLFNQKDLIPKIFRFLSWINVNSCCLVNSIWLYHGYNINSIYYFDSRIWFRKLGSNSYSKQKTRFLQRLINVKKFRYTYRINNWAENELLLNTFVELFNKYQNIQFIELVLGPYINNHGDVKFQKNIINSTGKHSRKLQYFGCDCTHNVTTDLWYPYLPILYLSNCNEIKLSKLLFPIMFTNKCNRLSLNFLGNIDKKWCDNIIDNCDFSGVKHLLLNDISFAKTMSNIEKHEIIGKLVPKLYNLQRLSIEKPTNDIVLLWKTLLPIIKKNNTFVDLLNIDNEVTKKYGDETIKFINKNQCHVNVLTFRSSENTFLFGEQLLSMKNIQKSIEKIAVYHCADRELELLLAAMYPDETRAVVKDNKNNKNSNGQSKLKHSNGGDYPRNYEQLKSLYIDAAGDSVVFDVVIEFLSITSYVNPAITNNAYFVCLNNFAMYYRTSDKDNFSSKMTKLFEMIENLIENQIPMNINIDFNVDFQSRNIKTAQQNEVITAFENFYQMLFLPMLNGCCQKWNSTLKTLLSDHDDDGKCSNLMMNPYCRWLNDPKYDFIIHDLIHVNRYGTNWSGDDIDYRDSTFDVATLKIQTARSI